MVHSLPVVLLETLVPIERSPSVANIFQPNAHSKWKISTHPVSPENRQLVAEVAARMSDQKIVEVREIKEGVNSSNFIVRYAGDTLLFRCNLLPKQSSELEWLGLLMEYLCERSVPVPRPLRFAYDGNVFAITHRGSSWQCSQYVNSEGHFRGLMEELVSAAVQIAKLHKALEGYPCTGSCPTLLLGSLSWNRWEAGLETIPESVFGTMVRKNEKKLRSLIDEVNVGRAEAPYEQLIHADIHPQNLLCRNASVVGIIDFDALSVGPLILDLANACHRLVRQSLCLAGGDPLRAPEFVHAFLSAYQRESEILGDALPLLSVYMYEIILRKIATNIELLSAHSYSDADAVEEMERWVVLLEEVEVLSGTIRVFS